MSKNYTKSKGGRPEKAIKRDAATGIRFTEAEYEIVQSKAKISGCKLTVYIREMSLNGHVQARLSTEEKGQIKSLAGIANNVNQLAKKAHQEGLVKAAISFEETLNILEQIIAKAKA